MCHNVSLKDDSHELHLTHLTRAFAVEVCVVLKNGKFTISAEMQLSAAVACVKRSLCESAFTQLSWVKFKYGDRKPLRVSDL